MMYFKIEFDENRMIKDEIMPPHVAFDLLEVLFSSRNITLLKEEGTCRYYTRNIDENDYAYLWEVNLVFKKVMWFAYYVKTWLFQDVNPETGRIYREVDLLADWTDRPTTLEY